MCIMGAKTLCVLFQRSNFIKCALMRAINYIIQGRIKFSCWVIILILLMLLIHISYILLSLGTHDIKMAGWKKYLHVYVLHSWYTLNTDMLSKHLCNHPKNSSYMYISAAVGEKELHLVIIRYWLPSYLSNRIPGA